MNTTARLAVSGLTCWLALAGLAAAQVAVPSIVPATVRIGDPAYGRPSVSFVPPNPAAMQWGAPARLGGGTISASHAPVGGTNVDFSGIYLGGVKWGEKLSFGGAYLDLADQTNAVTLEADWSLLAIAASFQSGDRFAFGAGVERTGNTHSLDAVDFNTSKLGLSVQFGKAWYAGLVMGNESVDSSLNGSGTRSVQMLGVGYRSGGQEHMHLELYVVDRDSVDMLVTSNELSDARHTVLVAEFQLGQIVLAGSYALTTKSDAGVTGTAWFADIGWAPKRGIALLYHMEGSTTQDDLLAAEYDGTASAVSFAYSF